MPDLRTAENSLTTEKHVYACLLSQPADLGIYQGDPSALHFPERKSGILRLKDPAAEGDESKDRCLQTTHAEPCFLRIVSFTHYLAFATQLAVALAYFNYVQPAATVAHAAAVHVPFDGALPFLLVAGPLFQAMGGAGPNVMHEYEGFMVSLTLQPHADVYRLCFSMHGTCNLLGHDVGMPAADWECSSSSSSSRLGVLTMPPGQGLC